MAEEDWVEDASTQFRDWRVRRPPDCVLRHRQTGFFLVARGRGITGWELRDRSREIVYIIYAADNEKPTDVAEGLLPKIAMERL